MSASPSPERSGGEYRLRSRARYVFAHDEPVRLTVMMCCRDDWKSLVFVLSEFRSSLPSFVQVASQIEVLVVDDSVGDSLDEEELRSIFDAAEREALAFKIVRGPGDGLSAAMSLGLLEISRRSPRDFVLMLDADGQHDIRLGHDLLRMALATGTDCVIGSRWARGGSAPGLSVSRRWFSKLARVPLWFAGVPRKVRDPTTSFRCYSPRACALLAREGVGFKGFALFPAAIALLCAEGMQVRESPISFRPRLTGRSSLSFGVVWRTLMETFSIASQCAMLRHRSEWFTESESTRYVGVDELLALESAVRFQRYVAELVSSDDGGNYLEIGAGGGASTRALLEVATRNRAVVTMDLVEPDSALRASLQLKFSSDSRITNIYGELGEIGGSRYRRIFLFSVLEHVEDDIAFLRQMCDLLEPGGSIIIFVPRLPAMYGTIDGSSGHYRRYRRNEIASVAALSGLRVTSCKGVDVAGWLPYWANYVLRRNPKISPRAVGMADRFLVPVSKLLDRAKVISNFLSKNLLVEMKVAVSSDFPAKGQK